MEINFIGALERREVKDGIKGAVNAWFVYEDLLRLEFETALVDPKDKFSRKRACNSSDGEKEEGLLKFYELIAKRLPGYIVDAGISKRKLGGGIYDGRTLANIIQVLVHDRKLNLKLVYEA